MRVLTLGDLAFLSRATPPASGGGGWTVIATAVGAAGSTALPAINTTGATLIIAVLSGGNGSAPTDNRGNTAVGRTARNTSPLFHRVYEWVAPSVGSGHVFSKPLNVDFMAVLALSGNAASPFDSESGFSNSSAGTSIQAGSLTPTLNGCLLISGVGMANTTGSPVSIEAGWTVVGTLSAVPGVSFGGGMAYKIQTTAAAENPTWSWPTSTSGRAATLTAYRAA